MGEKVSINPSGAKAQEPLRPTPATFAEQLRQAGKLTGPRWNALDMLVDIPPWLKKSDKR